MHSVRNAEKDLQALTKITFIWLSHGHAVKTSVMLYIEYLPPGNLLKSVDESVFCEHLL